MCAFLFCRLYRLYFCRRFSLLVLGPYRSPFFCVSCHLFLFFFPWMSLFSLSTVLLSYCLLLQIYSHPPSIISFLLFVLTITLLFVMITNVLFRYFRNNCEDQMKRSVHRVVAIVSWRDVISNKSEIGRKATNTPSISSSSSSLWMDSYQWDRRGTLSG